jgi:Na+-driven multidrug efflux pump
MAACVITTFQMILLVAFRDQIISAFTSNVEIQETILAAWPVLVIFTFFDTT